MELSCHCKNIVINAPVPNQLTACNCSICSRYQARWGYFAPLEVTIFVGEGGEQVYCWGDKMLEFVRCAVCGCVTHYRTLAGDPNPKIAVNFQMAPEVDFANVSRRNFNGRDLL